MNIYFMADKKLFENNYLEEISKYGNIIFMGGGVIHVRKIMKY